MRVLAQDRDSEMFLVGMSLDEYITQVKTIVDNYQKSNASCKIENMYSEEEIVRRYEINKNSEIINGMICSYYGTRNIFDVYVDLKKDLTIAFLAKATYPFDNMWNGYSPYVPYYGSGVITSIAELKDLKFNRPRIEIKIGDITEERCGAIVNSANEGLKAGGGVCGAIFQKAGFLELQKECDEKGLLEAGEAVITKGYNLPAHYIIHTVGPIYRDDSSSKYLRMAYLNSLKVADKNNIHSIAFPSISTGAYGYPLKKAAKIAMDALTNWQGDSVDQINMVCFDKKTYEVYLDAYKNSDYYKNYKDSVVKMFKYMKEDTSLYLYIRSELDSDKTIMVPSIKLINRTGEILFINNSRNLNFIRYQIKDYDYRLFFEILKDLENEKMILTCDGDCFENEYTTTISFL